MKPEIRIEAPGFKLTLRLGDGAPTPTIGSAYEDVPRPRKPSLLRYTGGAGEREAIAVLLDGWAQRESVERDLRKLRRLLEPEKEGKDPPRFRVRGPIHLAGQRVVLEEIEFGNAIRRRRDGVLVRQALTLTIAEYRRGGELDFRKRGGGGGGSGVGWSSYVTKEGETLRSIAVKLRPEDSRKEQAEYAKQIGKLNGIRDTRKKLSEGRELKLP